MSLLNDASLVFIPSGYKEDKVYSVIPSNGAGDLDFVRGCDATRINPQALVENTPWNIITYSQDFTNAAWTKINSVITANSTIAPDGTNTATKFESSASGVPQFSQTFAGTNTISIYAKAGNISIFSVWIGSGVTFDLSTGTVTSGVATIENAGNGWYRCIIPSVTSNTFNPYFAASASGQYVYIWGAQANIGSTAKPYFPTTDRLNVPRLTYSPTLIERQSTNLALYSQQFDNATWVKYQSSVLTPNVATAPDGTLTADKLQVQNGATYSGIYQIMSGASDNYTVSIYAKKDTKRWLFLFDAAANYNSWFDLENGVVGTVLGTSTANIQDVGNGWYRCSVKNNVSASPAYFQFGFSDADYSNTPSSTGTAFIWGAQLETGSLTSYIPTTSTAVTRVASYNSGCPSLLLEKQSINLVTYSEQFDNAVWLKSYSTISANAAISPDGTQNADKLIISNGLVGGYVYYPYATTPGTVYTGSFYVKAAGNNYTTFYTNISGSYQSALINLTNGAITNSTFTTTPLVQNVGNDWFRVSYTITSSGGFVPIYVDGGSTSTGGAITGNGVDGIYIWGAQLEISSYPTSYIPTTSASVTRLADSCSKTGISSLIGQTEGTMFLDTYFFNNNTTQVLLSLHDFANDKRLEIWSDNSTINGFIGGSVNVSIGSTTVTNGRHKLAVAYKSGNSAYYVDGVQIGVSSTSFTIAALTSLIYSYWSGIYKGEQSVNEVLLFKRRLTNTELANLTTL